jgi:p-methyltransferase
VYAVTPLGEAAFLGLLGGSASDLAGLTLPGCWVRSGRGYVRDETPEPGLPIDDHYVRWDEIEQDGLYHVTHTRTARSCAFKCSFCSYPANQGALTLSEPDTLRAELSHMRRSGRIDTIVFTDDTFNVPMPRFKELCRVLAEFDFRWYSYFRSQFADQETVDLMVDSGCQGVFLGYESLDDRVLKNMHKAVNRRAYERGTEFVKRAGLMTHANFIVGFPGDVPENVQSMLDFVDEYEIDTYYMTPWFCSPATPISNERERFGVEGNYFHWKHATMDSDRAMELEDWCRGRTRHSVWLTDLGARGFWSMVQLHSNGLSVAEARRAVGAFNAHVGRDTARPELEANAEFQWLGRRLREARFPEPPGIELYRGSFAPAPAR